MSRAVLLLNTVDLNDGEHTKLMPGIKLPRRDIAFDEVRSYTGAIRQVDIRQPLVQATIPLMVVGSTMVELEEYLGDICVECLSGGTLTWQEASDNGGGDGGNTIYYRFGISPEPEIEHDHLYRHHNIARFDLVLWVALSAPTA